MAQYNYSTKLVEKENTAKAVGRDLAISTKQTIEVCNLVRKMNVEKAKKLLSEVISKKQAVPFKRFNGDMGHKRKIGPGRYPVNTCTEILRLLESASTNAQFKGLNATSLIIAHINAQGGARRWHYGRKRRRQMKRTNVEIVLEEIEAKKEEKKVEKKEKPVEKKEAPKKETPAVKKEEQKEDKK